jgi:hypothetical protein
MSARDEILANIRSSLGVTGAEAPRRMAVQERLARAPTGIVPGRGQGDDIERAATFKAEAARAQASVAEVDHAADVPAEIARYLREANLPAALRMGEDARLAAMPWGETALEITHGPSDGHDHVGVSAAFAGIAESGTLALCSDHDQFPARQSRRHRLRARYRRRLRKRLAKAARALRQGGDAAHPQSDHRPIAISRYRADAAPRRARPTAAAYRDRKGRVSGVYPANIF